MLSLFFASAMASILPQLPHTIRCHQETTDYQIVLITQSPKLPAGTAVLGLKRGTDVVFKVAAQMTVEKGDMLTFTEIPATAKSRIVRLNPEGNIGTIENFRIRDLMDFSLFDCEAD